MGIKLIFVDLNLTVTKRDQTFTILWPMIHSHLFCRGYWCIPAPMQCTKRAWQLWHYLYPSWQMVKNRCARFATSPVGNDISCPLSVSHGNRSSKAAARLTEHHNRGPDVKMKSKSRTKTLRWNQTVLLVCELSKPFFLAKKKKLSFVNKTAF